jgi:hypothetical protein
MKRILQRDITGVRNPVTKYSHPSDLTPGIWTPLLYVQYIIIFSGSAAQRGLWPPRARGFVITHNDAPQSVGLLWTSDQLVAETST